MSGYSGTPLAQKLGVKAGHTLVLLGAPNGFDTLLVGLPDGVKILRRLPARACDVILLFVTSLEGLEAEFPTAKAHLAEDGGLWVCWPKKASKVPTDLTEDVVRAVALKAGLVDNKVCALDETWSGLRLVVRLRDRTTR